MKNQISFRQSNYTIGFLIDSFFNDVGVEIWKNIHNFASSYNVNLLTFTGGHLDSIIVNYCHKNTIYNLIQKNNVDGIIALSGSIGNYVNSKIMKDFFKRFNNIPIVSIGSEIKGIPSIFIDNSNGMYKLISHLIKKHGCKKIAFIKGPDGSYDAIERFKGYKKALFDNNINLNNNIIVQGDFSRFSGIKAIEKLMNNNINNIDAVVGTNDNMILEALKVLKRNNIVVPSDLIIAGFDNILTSEKTEPSLTTVNQPFFEIAETAINLIVKKIKKIDVPDKIVLPTKLIIRESCGCKKFNNLKSHIAGISKNKIVKFNNNEFKNHNLILHEIIENLLLCQEISELRIVLNNDLCKLGINSYYLVCYEKNNFNNPFSVLICSKNEKNEINNFHNRFHSLDIIPGGIKNIKFKKSFIILTLFFEENHYGYIVFEKGSVEGVIYESLAIHIINVLRKILQFKENKISNLKNLNVLDLLYKDKKKYRNSSLSKTESKKYYNELIEMMSKEKLYLNPDINMYHLADKLSISYNHLSQIINENSNLNFNDFINSFRIERIKNKLLKFNNDNILEIAYGTGFNSKSSFYNVFKKHLSMTPKQYIKKMSSHI